MGSGEIERDWTGFGYGGLMLDKVGIGWGLDVGKGTA